MNLFFDDETIPCFRPPSEANSFILRLTRGCAHNKCTYCNMYREVQFSILKDEEISRQIALAANYKDQIRRIFLADGDALVLSTDKLLKILNILSETFPNLERVSTYAAPKDMLRKNIEELKALKNAGLKLFYYGMETGDDETLKAINKGVNAEESIEAGHKTVEAGITLSIMIILGIAGTENSERHALATANALNIIKPNMLSALSLMLYRGSELKEQFERGEFHPLPPAGLMRELEIIIKNLNLPQNYGTLFRSNHYSNYINFRATLPDDKERLLKEINIARQELSKMKNYDVYNFYK